jgi:DNA-binding transcriptional LysR family regulator
MNYEQLRSFVAFAERRNFTHAAKQLAISQPALHVQIKKLAEDVGCALYRRDGRALVLTPEGERLAAYGREIAERGDEVLAELRGEHASGPVVLAAGQGAFLYLLADVIKRFPKDRWPLRLLSMTGPETIAAVRDARAHVGVIATNDPPNDLATRPIRQVRQRVIVPASHRLAKRKLVHPKDLAGEALVVAPQGSPHRAMLAQALANVPWTVAVEATGWELVLAFARGGMGLAIVNDFCEPPRGMVGVPPDGAPPISYYAVHRGAPRSPGIQHLLELIVRLTSKAH